MNNALGTNGSSITGGDFAGISTGMSFNPSGITGTTVGTISCGTFGALIGSETTPFLGYRFNIIDGSTISDITGGVFTG